MKESMTIQLEVINYDRIPAFETIAGNVVVIGRQLHALLLIKDGYANWFGNLCDNGLREGCDYITYGDVLHSGERRASHLIYWEPAARIAFGSGSPFGKAIGDKLLSLGMKSKKALRVPWYRKLLFQ